jgi:uncharacterized repeat protein (TIGR01451 family)
MKRLLFVHLAVLLLLAAFAAPPAMALGTPSGTAISNQAFADFNDANGNPRTRVYSNTVTVTVTQVAGVSTEPPTDTGNGIPGSTANYPLQICNTGNGNDTITFAATNVDGWTVSVILDANGNGVLDAGETTVVNTTGVLGDDDCFKVIVVVSVPPGATNGFTSTTTVTATSTFNNSVTDSSTFTTNVQAAALNLSKLASLATAKPGDIITYAVRGTNLGAGAAYNILAVDTIPANTTYVPNSMRIGPLTADPIDTAYLATIPLSDANDAQNVSLGGAIANGYWNSGSNRVELTWSECSAPDLQGTFYFQVVVNANASAGVVISNSLTANYSLLSGDMTRPYTAGTGTAQTTVLQVAQVLLDPDSSKSGDPGDVIAHPFTVTNQGNGPDTINLTYSSTPTGWTWVFWNDVNNDGIAGNDGDYILTDGPDAGTAVDTGVLAQGATMNVLAVATIPAGSANNAVETTVVTGTSAFDPTKSDIETLTTTVTAPVIAVLKEITAVQAPGGGAVCTTTNTSTGAPCVVVPGSVLTYRVTAANTGAGSATTVVITDMIPTYTAFVSGSIRIGASAAALTPKTDAMGDDGAGFNATYVIVPDGGSITLGPAGTQVLEFKVTVQ